MNPSGRFPKTHRLLIRRQFQAVQKGGVRSSDALMTVIGLSNGDSHSRLGITVSKRVSKRAVDRNRLKRLIREDFRSKRRGFSVNTNGIGIDIVVIVKQAALQGDSRSMQLSIDHHWKRILKKCSR